ncbi:MAG: ATP-binding cassette domain-containing protein [Bacteroidales bacterium]|nr:ATP-binding cassette domain-containing protein [Bacteroidales bacterium]
MSEQILEALMELFAIIARPESNLKDKDSVSESFQIRRKVVESFLKRQLNLELIKKYLDLFDKYYSDHKELSIVRDSVKILKIIDKYINKELTQKQKIIVLVQLFEFINSDTDVITDQEFEFIETVAQSFYISDEEYNLIKEFTLTSFDEIPDNSNILLIDNNKDFGNLKTKHLYSEFLVGQLRILNVVSTNIYFLKYHGINEMYVNGQLLQQDRAYVLHTGSSIRNHHVKPIYYSDIVSTFNEDLKKSKIVFEIKDISYRFKNNKTGLFNMSFTEESGRLVGIMGASGAGKSTLLNVLNGSARPTTGQVLINGVDIHGEKEKIEGLIGHVSQDDLLIEELTVFQNLYYNAKLCFSHYSQQEIIDSVNRVLQNLGLYEIKDIQVGTPLNKKISGGQRKRLNIALELIREPAVLFLDEPTSGLSSRDSENIMDLLKDLTLKGKLVFVVIHQPSSDIFKMLDRLLILDTGGYLIYNGDPIDSIVYFKSKVHHANWSESECHACGNVNPEQIFNIVESPIVDEYGKQTQHRKITPKEWNEYYNNISEEKSHKARSNNEIPCISFKIPNKLIQFFIFVVRDVLSKLANTQYLIITFLEAPVLALILAFIIKYYDVSATNELGYTFIGNSNLPVYIFMSVIVAIFMGLTVSAEEIIKDRKILKREAFLNLSWMSYLFSKVAVMLGISAIQAFTFVLLGNSIIEIKGMFFEYWLILFSAWAASNIMGLVISDSFKTVVTIYILIPFLVIPQIILSGVMVKYEKLNPAISSPSSIPVYGELMTARWGYEALAVHQFTENDYMQKFYPLNKVMSNAEFKKNYWVRNLLNKLDYLEKNFRSPQKRAKNMENLSLLRNEIGKELNSNVSKKLQPGQNDAFQYLDSLYLECLNERIISETRAYINKVNKIYIRIYNRASDERDRIIRDLQKTPEEKNSFLKLKREFHNDKLAEFVENTNEVIRIVEYKANLYQKIDPVYLDPDNRFLKAHFYAPRKQFFGKYYSTFWVNTIVIWAMSIILFIILYFRLLKKAMDYIEGFSDRWKKQTGVHD